MFVGYDVLAFNKLTFVTFLILSKFYTRLIKLSYRKQRIKKEGIRFYGHPLDIGTKRN